MGGISSRTVTNTFPESVLPAIMAEFAGRRKRRRKKKHPKKKKKIS
jgi:hypothetical protein